MVQLLFHQYDSRCAIQLSRESVKRFEILSTAHVADDDVNDLTSPRRVASYHNFVMARTATEVRHR